MTEDEAKQWIGRRIIVRPGAPKQIVGSEGRVIATQWHYLDNWVLVVELDKHPNVEYLMRESMVREEAERIPGCGTARKCVCGNYNSPERTHCTKCQEPLP
jgi:hypothetical protein